MRPLRSSGHTQFRIKTLTPQGCFHIHKMRGYLPKGKIRTETDQPNLWRKSMRKRKYRQLPIREGCYVEFRHTLSDGYQRLCSGYVTEHYYDENGIHRFKIQSDQGWKSVTVPGVRLYSNVIKHIQGERSKIEERRAQKQHQKKVKKARRKRKRNTQRPSPKSFSRREYFDNAF